MNPFLVAVSCLLACGWITGNARAVDAKTKKQEKRNLPAEVSQLATNLYAVSNKVESVIIGVNGISNKVEAVANEAAGIKGRLNSLEGRVQQLEVVKAKTALKMDISRVKAVMEDATYQLEKYGSIHVSTPLLTSPTNDFLFNLRRGATNYFEEAKTNRQGGASFFEQTVQAFAARVAGQFDPVVAASYTAELGKYYSELNRFQKKQSLGDEASQAQLLADLTAAGTNMQAVAQAQQAYAARFQAVSNSPAFPTTQSGNLGSMFTNELARPEVTNVFAQPKFADFQGLLTQQQVRPVLDNRSAIIQAAGDNAVESIFYLLGNPKQADQFKNQRVFFGLVTVGVDPGWRTKKGYAAEVVVSTELTYKRARTEVILKFLQGPDQHAMSEDLLAYLCVSEGVNPGELGGNLKPFVEKYSGPDYEDILKTFNQGVNLFENNVQEIRSFFDQVGKDKEKGREYLREVIKKIQTEMKQPVNKESTEEERVFFENASRSASILKALTLEYEKLSQREQGILISYSHTLSRRRVQSRTLPEVPARFLRPSRVETANVLVISPLTDSQSLDLASSQRRQVEIALSLSVIMRMTGGKGQAEAFENFAKSRQFDIRTVSQLTSVNAFSSDGVFGFQVGPRMQAIGGAKKNNGPESLMERQSFPALLVLGLNNVNFQVKLNPMKDNDGYITNITVLEPALELTQTRRWQPLERKGILGADWYKPINWFKPRLNEETRVEMAEELQGIHDRLPATDDENMLQATLRKRVEHLQAQIMGGRSLVYFDPDQVVKPKDPVEVKLAEIEKVLPEKLIFTEGQENAFNLIFFGKYLKTVSTITSDAVAVIGNGVISKITPMGDALVVEGKLNDAKISTLMLRFKADSGAGEYNILSRPVTVVADKKNNEGGAGVDDLKGASSLSLKSMVNAKEGLTNVLSVTISKDIPEAHLKAAGEIIRTELEKNKSNGDKGSANVNVNVQAGTLTTTNKTQ